MNSVVSNDVNLHLTNTVFLWCWY